MNNGSVNEGFLYEDGKILNRPGINKLCKNLKLALKQNIKDLTKRPNPPQMPLRKSFTKTAPPIPNKDPTFPPQPVMAAQTRLLGIQNQQQDQRGDTTTNADQCHSCFRG